MSVVNIKVKFSIIIVEPKTIIWQKLQIRTTTESIWNEVHRLSKKKEKVGIFFL